LHDGVQQHLVAQGIDLGLAEQKMASDPEAALELLRDARAKNRDTIGELRIIGRGLHPAVLDDRGLDAALSALSPSLCLQASRPQCRSLRRRTLWCLKPWPTC
jgi:signal transduction histidine kinase